MAVSTAQPFNVIIIGAGGAGLMCALTAAKRRRSVLVLDHGVEVGQKILISGGGRCNFTNRNVTYENYVSENPHFCKSALSQFPPHAFIALVERHGIPYYEKKLGQLFCEGKGAARKILNMLLDECAESGVKIHHPSAVSNITRNDQFLLETSTGRYASNSLVIATGGLSIPQIGATGFGYEVAKQFGINVIEPEPALDGFIFDSALQQAFADLAGASLDCIVTCGKTAFRENLLFTHKGLSGPAMLQASLYWRKGSPIEINLLPDTNAEDWLLQAKRSRATLSIEALLAEKLPKRFAHYFLTLFVPAKPLGQFTDTDLRKIAHQLLHWRILPTGTVGFAKAEVTRGGVDTKELSSKTMEAKKVPGLYFIGEVVDVTGWLGGYNFQWAWSSGYVAGLNV